MHAQSGEGATASAAPVAAAASSSPQNVPPYPINEARLVFDLYYGEDHTLVGQVEYSWWQSDGRYLIESKAEAVGFASLFFGRRYVQRSEGYISQIGLQPMSYSLDRDNKEERADFLWDQNKLRFQRGQKQAETPLRMDAQDVLSILQELYFMQPFSHDMLVNVATGHKLESYIFQALGEVDLITPLGRVRSLHLKRTAPDGSITEVWLDRDRYLLPLKIYSVNRKGYVLEQDIRELSFSLLSDEAAEPGGQAASQHSEPQTD
jgi:hypothetical protein